MDCALGNKKVALNRLGCHEVKRVGRDNDESVRSEPLWNWSGLWMVQVLDEQR